METKKLNLDNFKVRCLYEQVIAGMRKQYKDVVQITALHVNAQGKIFSAEWIDSKGVFNFCGGYAIDAVKILKF
jgi:hypothetical protein